MRRRLLCILFAAMVLLNLGMQAQAAEVTGSIRVILNKGNTAVSNGEVTLYRVGMEISGGYRLTEAFGGGIIKEEDTLSPALAQWLAEKAGEGGIPRILDADGCAEFSRLSGGLYLLVQNETGEGYYPIAPFLIPLPYEGEWDIQANPKLQQILAESPQTGQSPMPFLGVMGMVLSGTGLICCARGKRRK